MRSSARADCPAFRTRSCRISSTVTASRCWGSGPEEDRVIITNVEAIVLDTGKDYPDPAAAGEAHGVRFVSLLKISTDVGITGWSDIETQPHVGKAIVDAPSGGAV